MTLKFTLPEIYQNIDADNFTIYATLNTGETVILTNGIDTAIGVTKSQLISGYIMTNVSDQITGGTIQNMDQICENVHKPWVISGTIPTPTPTPVTSSPITTNGTLPTPTPVTSSPITTNGITPTPTPTPSLNCWFIIDLNQGTPSPTMTITPTLTSTTTPDYTVPYTGYADDSAIDAYTNEVVGVIYLYNELYYTDSLFTTYATGYYVVNRQGTFQDSTILRIDNGEVIVNPPASTPTPTPTQTSVIGPMPYYGYDESSQLDAYLSTVSGSLYYYNGLYYSDSGYQTIANDGHYVLFKGGSYEECEFIRILDGLSI